MSIIDCCNAILNGTTKFLGNFSIEGTEVLKRIRGLETDIAKVPIIAMTSYAMAGDRERLLAAGCNGYIEKPINPMQVIEQIKKIIGKVP